MPRKILELQRRTDREREGRPKGEREGEREEGLWKHVIHLSKYRKLISKPWFLLIFQKYQNLKVKGQF